MIRICFDTKNEFYAYMATGVIMMILFHVLENIGMTIGLLPITGIPLPFISQGGSALLGNMLGIGLVMSMRYHYRSYMFSDEGRTFRHLTLTQGGNCMITIYQHPQCSTCKKTRAWFDEEGIAYELKGHPRRASGPGKHPPSDRIRQPDIAPHLQHERQPIQGNAAEGQTRQHGP